ncbi:hypothetical protein HHK36_032524 [Tetracentron sinense]|uniref:TF-B3 domain-containing protein n=1 Tax=Tetracentron sinense TaxID=13715 RepID=A0A834Y7Z8_TETSI|nr:hypothetical protein HHK36_032524 [Tetracentron sinense]
MFSGRDATFNFIQSQETINEIEEGWEHMFEKPLTPSDVGKLNRLVIPKQHAEKYFPISSDSCSKGLLLSFEDESGKSWRFRYSYWSSSQSYVMTKGWSRFVKEKLLVAGDVVSFDRRRLTGDRLFIRWRHRVAPVQDRGVAQPISTPLTHLFYSAQYPYPSHPHGPLLYQLPDCLHAGVAVDPVVENNTTPGNSKRLRLFGVNFDCQLDGSEPPRTDGLSLSSQGSNHDYHKVHTKTQFLPRRHLQRFRCFSSISIFRKISTEGDIEVEEICRRNVVD